MRFYPFLGDLILVFYWRVLYPELCLFYKVLIHPKKNILFLFLLLWVELLAPNPTCVVVIQMLITM
jgi:hypothetical protein